MRSHVRWMVRRLARCWLLALIALALVPVWPLVGRGFAQSVERHGSTRFGVVEAYYRPGDARDLGVGWERIIFEWAQFQPSGPDEYQTGVIPDDWLSDAQANGREVIGLLKNTPLWASDMKKLGAPPNGLDLPIDDPGNYWAAFVRRTVAYYGAQWGIHHWIVYNEPDLRPGELSWYEFDGDVRDYFNMVRVAYLAAKSVDPNAVIHLAGMAWWGDVEAGRVPYLQRFMQIAVTDVDAYANNYYFDVASVHVYFGTQNVWQLVVDTRRILERFGLEKPIWIDETNASPTLDPLAPMTDPVYAIGLDQQAAYIVQAAALSMAAGADRFAVYRLYDDHFVPGQSEPWGLVRADGSRRPAFMAYKMVINQFSGTTAAQRYYSGRSMMVTLRQPGRTVYVMWARGPDPLRFHVWAGNPGETATQIDLYGATHAQEVEAVPGVEDWWYVLDAPGATPDDSGTVMIQGSPVILAVDGPVRPVWIEVEGAQWQLIK